HTAGLNLYSLAPARSWATAVFAVAAGLAGGAFGAALIAVINTALNDAAASRRRLAAALLVLVVRRAAAHPAARPVLQSIHAGNPVAPQSRAHSPRARDPAVAARARRNRAHHRHVDP